MSKAIELAIEADSATGFPIACIEAQKIKPFLERFYALSRADLEAECERRKTQFASAEFAVNELKAENAKLREVNKMLDSALCRAYPNGCYHGDVFELWNTARTALGETK